MRLLFLGSGAFAIPSLEAVLGAGHDVAAVVTQPDREKGRGQELHPPPLKPIATAHGLAVLQPRRVRDPTAVEALRALRPEVLVAVAYGQILPPAVLDLAPHGAINVHGSLLPRWRGAAPIQWAIASGDAETGVTTMQLDEGLDTGPTFLAEATRIGAHERAPDLEDRLSAIGARLLLATLRGVASGALVGTPQDPALATHARILKKEDGRLDWRLAASALECRVRGFDPWPGAFTSFDGGLVKVRSAIPEARTPGTDDASPGTVLSVDPHGIAVACGASTQLRVLEVQPESRRAMPATAFAAGRHLLPGARFS